VSFNSNQLKTFYTATKVFAAIEAIIIIT